MEKYATFSKTFEECLMDNPKLAKNNEIIVTISNTQYVVKIAENKCKYYKALTPREI